MSNYSMPTSALLDKNAYLSIYISQDTISANLAYSHYEIGRHYVLHDKTYFYRQKDNVEDQKFWDEYFDALSKKFNWSLINTVKDDISLAQPVEFQDEGSGIAGISLIFHGGLKNRVKIQSILHTYLPTASIKIVNEDWFDSFIPELGEKLDYTDVIHLNTDVEKFDLHRFKNIRNKKNEKAKGKDKYSKTHVKLHWDNKPSLINSIKDKRFTAFSSIDTTSPVATNVWANYILRPVDSSDNKDLVDLIRSYLTVQLASLNHNSPNATKKFGGKNERSLLVISGRLARLLDPRVIVLSLMDGLQLFGNFDLYIDTEDRLITFGEMYAKGINSPEFIVPGFTVLEKIERVFSVEVEGKKGKRHAIFSGEIIGSGVSEQIYSVSPVLDQFELPYPEDRPSVFTGRLQKKSYIEGLDREVTVTSSPETSIVRNVFLDSRRRPIVYGPDPSSNRNKLKVWIGE